MTELTVPDRDDLDDDKLPSVPDTVDGYIEDGVVTIADPTQGPYTAWISYEPHSDELRELNKR